MRYQLIREVNDETCPAGTQVRITLRHHEQWPSLTYEGPVRLVIWDRERKGIIAGTPLPDQVRGIVGIGGFEMLFYPQTGWYVVSVERALPPLPTTEGSIVRKGDRAAVLMGRVDEPGGVWVWADTGEDTGPVLGDADIIHEAKYR